LACAADRTRASATIVRPSIPSIDGDQGACAARGAPTRGVDPAGPTSAGGRAASGLGAGLAAGASGRVVPVPASPLPDGGACAREEAYALARRGDGEGARRSPKSRSAMSPYRPPAARRMMPASHPATRTPPKRGATRTLNLEPPPAPEAARSRKPWPRARERPWS
jgi:hypothetical protein